NSEKTRKQYLPEKGDWGIGIDVVPLLKYIGPAFHDASGNPSDLHGIGGTPFTKGSQFEKTNKTLMPDVSIMGKYFLSHKLALRANIGLKVGTETNRYYSDDDKAAMLDPLNEDKVINKVRNRKSGVSIMLGGEYRKGTRRVQGVFGAGILFACMNDKVKYDYGNGLTDINQHPTGSKWSDSNSAYRVLSEYNTGANFYTGITGSAGVEWFMAPKISLGAEVNLSLYYLCGKKTYIESEGYNKTLQRVEKRTDLISPGNRGFYMATESLGGSLNLNFYF
ncbi:MAG: hypothetical protein K2L23_07425, partial [Odoribacter sp.]|nr:hypothetical protein [Odoribacter sp.]